MKEILEEEFKTDEPTRPHYKCCNFTLVINSFQHFIAFDYQLIFFKIVDKLYQKKRI